MLLACTNKLPPQSNAAFTIQNGGCEAPCEVSFLAAAGEGLLYRWDLGGGNITTEQTAKKLYTNPGSYTVRLIVTGAGGSAISSQSVSIRQKGVTTRQYLNLPYATMALVPGGTFQLGDTRSEGANDEIPVHTVILSGFWMGQYEVTQRQWQAIMGNNPAHNLSCDDCPVEQVSWEDVQTFLVKLNQQRPAGTPAYRLPTEAEWEYAAGGGSIANRTRFGNGKAIANPAEMNYYGFEYINRPSYSVVGISRAKTVPVGSFSPNTLGLYDLSGNVWEWCQDWYAVYTSAAQTDPVGPASGTHRVFRGGSWPDEPLYCRIADRAGNPPSFWSSSGGFRIVCQAQ